LFICIFVLCIETWS